jgi:iron-sulfur cluster assembly protein
MDMITLTANAATKMQDALDNRGRGIGMRIGVRTAGCSGFAYVLEFADEVREHDIEIDEHGVTLLIDKKDLVYLQGMQIDYAKKGLNEGFEFQNPNAKAECGCGESFTV